MTGGWQVPGYTEARELGTGAQGRAVLVQHEHSGRPYVIKYLTAGDTAARQRFRRESELLKTIKSPYVAQWFGHIDEGPVCAILMEAVDGVSLKEVLLANEQLVPEAALLVLKGSLLGLDAAHQLGVVHRDYKPANVVVRSDGLSKLIDFGIADLTGVRDRSGTPLYMAPEQWLGDPATPSTDVYAATCVFFECITGRPPFSGSRDAHLNAPVPLHLVPEQLRGLVAAGLARTPAERPGRAAQFVAELETIAADAYGPDWEKRSATILGGAAGALGTLFAFSVTAGSTAVAGAGTTTSSLIGRPLLKRIGGAKGVLAVTAGATIAAVGATLFVPSDKPSPKARVQPPVAVTLASFSQSYPSVGLTVTKAPFPLVTGLSSPELATRVNTALREPLDWQIGVYRSWITGVKFPECVTKGSKLDVKVTLGATGPDLISARYRFFENTSCWEPGFFEEAVTVNLHTGRAVSPREIFKSGPLSTFDRTVDRQWVKNQKCEAKPTITWAALETRQGLTGTDAELLFTKTGLMVTVGTSSAAGCVAGPIHVPYALIRTQIREEFWALLPH